MKKIFVLLLSFVIIFSLVACTEASDPTSEFPSMNKFSVSYSYSGNKDGDFFTFKFNWKEAETFSALYSHEYDLYWAMDSAGPFELCEPIEGYTHTCELYTLIPGEKAEFTINIGDKYENLPRGYYRFVFTFDVSENGGPVEKRIASIDFDSFA